MHSQTPMLPGTLQTHETAVRHRRPLRILRRTVAADFILRTRLQLPKDLQRLWRCLEIRGNEGKGRSAVRRRSGVVLAIGGSAFTGLWTLDSGLDPPRRTTYTSQSCIRKRTMLHAIEKDQCRGNPSIWMIEHRIDRRFRSYSPAIRHGAPGDRQRGCRLHRRVLGRSERRTIQ